MRSAVYRSFVTCDDPEGVIECGTIRKSRFCPKKMEEGKAIPSGKGKKKKKKNQKEEDDEEEDKSSRRRSSSVQLNEVAREALKLNRMADSYSNRSSFEGNSKEMAKDLLKGALDLQESLIMLGKLQESSINMAKLKKKEQNDQTLGFQKPRHSVSDDNGYSKDCFDELREAIREGLAKQNLLLKRRNPESSSSSSSSSSSMIQNSKQNLIRYSTRPGNPNLIAKLMGLDHIPPRANSYKQQVKKKFEDAQPPPIVVIKPARFLNPDFDTKEMLKICELNKKQMTKAADQKPVKRLNQELGLKDMRRTRFKHQEDSLKPKASVATVPRKKKEEGIQRRRNTPEQNQKPIAVSKSNGKTKKERIVHVPLTPPVPTISPRFQNSQHKRRQNNDKLVKAIKREEEEEEDDLKLTTPKEIVPILNNADRKEDSQSEISEEKSTINKIDTKDLLLNSPIFISYAEELFNLDIDTPPNTAVVDSRSENDRRLIIDYAKEFLQERCRNRRMKESFYTHTVTLEQLAEEVCNGIGSLGWLNDRPVKEDAGLDAVIIRSWELGRREMDLIVTELEKMISRDLFDSLITDINNL